MIKGEGTTEDPMTFVPLSYLDVEEMTEVDNGQDYLVITFEDSDGEQHAIGISPLHFELLAKKGLAIIDGEDL